MLVITRPAAKRPAAKPLPGRHRQPAHTAPARLRRHQVKLTGRSDIAAVAGGQRGGPHGGRPHRDLLLPIPRWATLSAACCARTAGRAAAWTSR